MAGVTVNAPGPLPLIMEICEDIGLIEAVNESVEWDETHCHLAPGQRIAALIMNVLTEGKALYHMDDFFEQTDTDNIFTATDPTDGVTPADLADHNLRSAIDKLVDAGPRTILMAVFQEVMAREGIDTNVLHGDVTTFSVEGLYEPDAEDPQEKSLDITYGRSKDRRKDRKQFKIGLVVNQTDVPVLGNSIDGNASELDWNRDLVDELRERTDPDAPLIYIGDSKAFSKETLEHCEAEDVDLITRLPHNYNAPDALIDQAWEADDWTNVGTFVQDDDDDEAAEYRLKSYLTEIHERTLRGIVVNSSELDGRTERRIDHELSRTEDALEEAIDDLEDRYFECEPDAESAAEEWLDEHDDLFTIDCNVTETERKKSRDKPGRPPKDWGANETVYRVEASQTRDEEAIATYKAKESFVVVTTLDVNDHWPDEAVLWEYKERQTVERRFPVLKDPKLVGPVYLGSRTGSRPWGTCSSRRCSCIGSSNGGFDSRLRMPRSQWIWSGGNQLPPDRATGARTVRERHDCPHRRWAPIPGERRSASPSARTPRTRPFDLWRLSGLGPVSYFLPNNQKLGY